MLADCAAILFAAILFAAMLLCPVSGRASDMQASTAPVPGQLAKLAATRFSKLTRSELTLLNFADVGNLNRGEWAAAGPSSDPNDPSNDPKDAATWGKDREVRARLIEWLAIDRSALPLIYPGGIHLLGARVAGPIDLSFVHVPFGIAMIRCSIPEVMRLEATDIPRLDLSGSYTSAIFAPDMHVAGSLYLGWDNYDYGHFHASDEVRGRTCATT